MPGPKGSPRPALAVSLLIANPGLTIEEAVQFFQKNMTGASAATSTLTESNMSSRKGAMKKVSAAEVPPLRSNVLCIIIKE
jgi:hypothetical protein